MLRHLLQLSCDRIDFICMSRSTSLSKTRAHMQESKCGDVGYMDAHCTSLAFQLNPCNVSLGTDALHGFWHHDIPVQMADASEGIPGRRCSQKWLQARNKETISKSFSMFPLLRLCRARPSGIFRWSPQVYEVCGLVWIQTLFCSSSACSVSFSEQLE